MARSPFNPNMSIPDEDAEDRPTWRRGIVVAIAVLSLFTMIVLASRAMRPAPEPKLSPEAMRAKQVLAMLPDGISSGYRTEFELVEAAKRLDYR